MSAPGTDQPPAPGWWKASDGQWYPPDTPLAPGPAPPPDAELVEPTGPSAAAPTEQVSLWGRIGQWFRRGSQPGYRDHGYGHDRRRRFGSETRRRATRPRPSRLAKRAGTSPTKTRARRAPKRKK